MIELAPNPTLTCAALEARVVRYVELAPCFNAFIDCRTPGSEAKENFTIIGPGVSENPAQHVHIAEAHGYNIGGARQPPHCVNSQHSHDTAEVFVAHTGTWRFDLGEHGDDAQVVLHPGDTISLPTGTFRGFTNIGDDIGFLWAVLGQDNPGRVTWAPRVFEMARDYGLVLLENGALVDTKAGQALPQGVAPMAPTSRETAAALTRYTPEQAEALVVRDTADTGVSSIIAPDAPLDWAHGFTLERIDLAAAERFIGGGNERSGKQVRFVHRGSITIDCADGAMTLDEGDTVTLPDAFTREFVATERTTVFAVQAA